MQYKKLLLCLALLGGLFYSFPAKADTGLGPTIGCVMNSNLCTAKQYCYLKENSCKDKLELNKNCEKNEECLSNYCVIAQGGQDKQCQNPETGEGYLKFAPIEPKLEIKIPTLQPFTTKGLEKPDAEGNIYIPFIGQYIVGIYKWAVLVAGIIAIIMIIYGGLQYMTSGGDATRAGEGKERIGSAIFGLILLLGSYLLLYLLNPDLVKFKSLKINVIERKEIKDITGDLTQDLTPQEAQIPGQGTANVPYFSQRGNATPFGACGTIASAGCGPTSLAMVLKFYGINTDPNQMAKEWADLGYRKCPTPPPTDKGCNGCANVGHGGMFSDQNFLNKYGLKSSFLGKDKEKILAVLQNKKPVIASMGPGIFTAKAHFIVLTGQNYNGSISVNDPNKTVYCANGATKCDASLQTITPAAVPDEFIFDSLKAATLIEPK